MWTAAPNRPFSTTAKSLLPIGITSVNGSFTKGAPVGHQIRHGQNIGKGAGELLICGYCLHHGACVSDTICHTLQMSRPYTEVIHRDNLAITCEHGACIMNIESIVENLSAHARHASRTIATADTATKNKVT